MIAGDDPTPWNLLHDGTIVRLERDLADTLTMWLDAPYLRARFADGGTQFRIRLVACTTAIYAPFDEPPITDLPAIASSEPSILEAQRDRGDILVWCSAGSLRLRYESLALELDTGTPVAIDELRRVVRAYWQEWHHAAAPVATHPLIRAVLDGQAAVEALPLLLAAWRTERTSELAKAIAILDERAGGSQRVVLEVEALRSAEPDPRIGRAIEDALEGPRDPASFADHALALLELHADAGTAPRLDDKANRLLYQAACDEAEMADHLRTLATKLRARFGEDRTLPETIAAALRSRG